MTGSWRWNLVAAVALAAVIFLLSYAHNPIATASMRSGIAFAAGFAVTFAVRWMLGQAAMPSVPVPERLSDEEGDKGRSVDLTTPEDDESDVALDFAPLAPPKLARTPGEAEDPRMIAEALRHMSEK
ncbi:hypothetical protein MO973_01995 [Paenibacillus sp. TRM 82003]|nr:hypothetical protein [Paenibacillus sp. TRM 82003]